jgi:hypothetical protein
MCKALALISSIKKGKKSSSNIWRKSTTKAAIKMPGVVVHTCDSSYLGTIA